MTRKSMSKKLRQKLKDKMNCRCGYCGELLSDKFHIDHKIPHRAGGTCDEDNLIASCISCNLQKTGMSVNEFRQSIENKLKQLELTANNKIARRYGLIKETQKKIVF